MRFEYGFEFSVFVFQSNQFRPVLCRRRIGGGAAATADADADAAAQSPTARSAVTAAAATARAGGGASPACSVEFVAETRDRFAQKQRIRI